MPAGTLTFLFTDIEGSTALWEQDGARMSQALAAHDAFARSAVERHRGEVVKMIGDGMHAVFEDALDALRATVDLQERLAEATATNEVPLHVRCGLHTGLVERRDNDYFGSTVNRAARIMSAAHGGQMLVSGVVAETLQKRLPPTFALRDLGSVRLKDLSAPEHIYQVLHPQLRQDFPALRSLEATPNNLPQQATTFIGREKELTEVRSLLARTRLLTLTGSGGCGKTRVSLQVAANSLETFVDGTWFVELQALSEPALVPQTMAIVLGLREHAGQSIIEALVKYLKDKQLLLILDNCEHLLDGCAHLAETLIRRCPRLTILASSREALGIAGEQTYRVPSLTLPDPKQAHSIASVTAFEAVQLFIERATLAMADFRVSNRNASTLASICNRLDGIPLAIELAAARVSSLSIEDINRRLDERFRLLTGGSRTALPRQRTLRSLIDWSYDLLNDAERLTLQRLSVFSDGWAIGSAEQVLPGDGIEDGDVLDLLTSLCDKSLVIFAQGEANGRYRLLETVRQYAREKLLESGRVKAVQARHRDCFLRLVKGAEFGLLDERQTEWLQRLDEEYENLRAALEWNIAEGELESNFELCHGIAPFWIARARFSDGGYWCGRVLQMPGAEKHSAAFQKLLNAAGLMAYHQSDYPAARAFFEKSLAITRQLGNRQNLAKVLGNMGLVATKQGHLARARALHEENLAIMREQGNQSGIAAAMHNLAIVVNLQGDFATARVLAEQSLAIKRQLGDPRRIANAACQLAMVVANQGDVAYAWSLNNEGLEMQRKLGDRASTALTLNHLATLACLQRDFSTAQTLSRESLVIMRELQHGEGIAESLMNVANAAYEMRDYETAQTAIEEALAIRRDRKDQFGIAGSLDGLAAIAAAIGHSFNAARIWGAVERIRAEGESSLSPIERKYHDRHVETARNAAKDGAAFDRAWRQGGEWTIEQAIAYACGSATSTRLSGST